LVCELILGLVSLWLLINSFKETFKEKHLIDFFIILFKDILIILLNFFKDILIILLFFFHFLIILLLFLPFLI